MKRSFIVLGLALSTQLLIAGDTLQPPVAKRIPNPVALPVTHCDQPPCSREDDYFWLRDEPKDGISFRADIIDYLNQENAYTEQWLNSRAKLRNQIYGELKSRAEANLSFDAPYKLKGYTYFKRQAPGQEYPTYWRKSDATGKEELVLDGPALAGDSKFFMISISSVSPNGKMLAYGIDRFGKRSNALYIKNLETGDVRLIREKDVYISGVYRQVVWSADSNQIFYSIPGTLSRDSAIARYNLSESKEYLAYDELDGDFYLSPLATASGKYIVFQSDGNKRSQVRLIPTATPEAEPLLLSPKKAGHKYEVQHVGNRFLILSSIKDGNMSLYEAPESDPTINSWKPLLKKPLMTDITNWQVFENHVVLIGVEKAYQRAKVLDLRTLKARNIPTPDKIFAVEPIDNFDASATAFRFKYGSWTNLLSLREVELESGKVNVLAEKSLPNYNPADYVSKRVWSKSFDGKMVPSDVVYKKGVPQDGKGPLYIWAYGNYGSSLISTYWSDQDRLAILDRGITFVMTYPRGGGEMGYEWGVIGNMRKKIDSFKDVIAVTHDLVAKGYGARDRLAFEGVSAGGLVSGYLANNEPKLFKAIIQGVPFVDLLNTMSDASIPLTTQEYVVWGNPADASDYRYMASYSPYDNVGKHEYPSLLVTSALGDSQVPYWEAAKWVARVRANKTDNNPVLLSMGMVGGHGGGSGVSGPLAEAALKWTFLIDQIGTRPMPAALTE